MDRRTLTVAGIAGGAFLLVVLAVLLFAGGSSNAGTVLQGDTDCSGDITSVDALHVLRLVAGLEPRADCVQAAGDVDCNEERNAVDALWILRVVAEMGGPDVAGCPPIGQPLETPTATPPGSPAATVSPGMPTETPTAAAPTATPTTPPAPTPTPLTTGCEVSTPSGTINGAYDLVPVVPGANYEDMLDFALIPGSTTEAVVVRQRGTICKVSLDGRFDPYVWGTVDVAYGGEQGLLSLAFSAEFASDGRVYLYYTTGAPGPSRLSRFQATKDVMDDASESVVLSVPQPYTNHNGGKLLFGPDGYLYLSLGDGGGAGDPIETGQDNTDLLGSVLRLDVTGEQTYGIPPGNPFAAPGDAGADEVWAYGLRNPWRMSMDRMTGDIWLGDVGQGAWEEVDEIVPGGNYGWDCKEGYADYETARCPDDSAFVAPRAAYPNGDTDNRAVTGGYVYRGDDIPQLQGWYVYGDAYSGRIWAVNTADSGPPIDLLDTELFISSFAELPDGELLVLTFGAGMYRLAP